MTAEQPSQSAVADLARSRLSGAGIPVRPGPLPEIGRGADNVVLAARHRDGRPLVIKVRRGGRPARYAIAAWACGQIIRARITVPDILWHDADVCVETRLAGTPLDRSADVRQAASAGQMLRVIHAITVAGFGRLDDAGRGRIPTLTAWLTARTPPDYREPGNQPLRARAGKVLRDLAPLLGTPTSRLLHGDWVARHVLGTGAAVTGVLDLESVRGGDPMADLAGWSVQEPANLTAALFTGYALDTGDRHVRLRLALHRLRIATALADHHRTGEAARVLLHTAQLEADLADLDAGAPRAIPRITPEPTIGRSHP